MSIQRFEGATAPDSSGRYVLYVDHVRAMEAEAESAHDLGVIYGINHERARIKAAVEAMPRWWEGVSAKSRLVPIDRVMAIIDGEQA